MSYERLESSFSETNKEIIGSEQVTFTYPKKSKKLNKKKIQKDVLIFLAISIPTIIIFIGVSLYVGIKLDKSKDLIWIIFIASSCGLGLIIISLLLIVFYLIYDWSLKYINKEWYIDSEV